MVYLGFFYGRLRGGVRQASMAAVGGTVGMPPPMGVPPPPPVEMMAPPPPDAANVDPGTLDFAGMGTPHGGDGGEDGGGEGWESERVEGREGGRSR